MQQELVASTFARTIVAEDVTVILRSLASNNSQADA